MFIVLAVPQPPCVALTLWDAWPSPPLTHDPSPGAWRDGDCVLSLLMIS